MNPLAGALDRLTRPPILTAVLAGLVGLQFLVVLVHLATLPPVDASDGAPGTGDFLAFYTGAALLAEGRGAELYDLDAQLAMQEQILAVTGMPWQPYVNPPGLAVLIAWVLPLGYRASFLLFCLTGVVLTGVAAVALRPHLPTLTADRARALATLLAVLAVQPVFHTLLGGQNTAITLAVLAIAYAAWRNGQAVVLGLCVGLLSYKPQYGVLFGVLLLLGRQWTAAGIAVLGGLSHYALGALYAGADWPLRMLETLRVYEPLELADEGPFHFSIPRVAAWTLGHDVGVPVGLVGSLAVAGVTVRSTWRALSDPRQLDLVWGLWLCGVMLVSPHLNDYDAGLLTLPVLFLVERAAARGAVPLSLRLAALALWALYFTKDWAPDLGFQPLFLGLLGTWLAMLRALAYSR
ncbi:MAG: glycosyltransferase family 87 protein [Myxococcota bacterium]